MHGVQTTDGEVERRPGEAPQELAFRELTQLAAPYGQHLCKPAVFGLELPYAAVGGAGFERLCFHLLLSQGYQPRFFGRSGEAQFGIDLIVSDGTRSSVYQCKNKAYYTAADLRFDLNLFAKRWLIDRPQLLRPQRFTICTTARLDQRADWELVKQDFFNAHGVAIEEWHRDMLDAWLRHEPDIVSDLFGDDVAERFCERKDWNDGLFRPILHGSGEKDIDRYLELKLLNRLVHNQKTIARFNEAVLGEGLILIEGLSGNGKTIAALDLANSLGDGTWRVFFVNLRNGGDEQQLFEGIKARCVRPTLFILDDSHRDWTTVERLVSRARYALKGRRFGLVLTAQTTASYKAEPVGADISTFLDECREQQITLNIVPTIDQYRQILARSRPALSGLSQVGIERLYAMTAQDLAVLDILLDALEDRALADVEVLSSLFPGILRRYFKHENVHASNLKSFAAIAQFDIAVPMDAIPHPFEQPENLAAVQRLTIKTSQPARGYPPSLAFIHASAAELIFRALSWVDTDENWSKPAARYITDYLISLRSDQAFIQTLEALLRARLRLSDDSTIKQLTLADVNISTRIKETEGLSLRSVSIATLLTCELGKAVPYSELLATRIKHMAANPESTKGEELPLIGHALRSLSLANPTLHAALEVQLGTASVLHLIRTNGSIVELLRTIVYSTSTFAAALVAALDSELVDKLLDRTIDEGRSIGVLSILFRDLAERELPDGRSQLDAIEAHLSVSAILRLVSANGTILELFGFFQRSTTRFAAQLVAALNAVIISDLIDKTIADGRSIATLDLSLREAGQREMPEGGSQLAAIEAHLSAAAILRLIRANGTIVELIKFLEHNTSNFAAGLIALLNTEIVEGLIDKAIDECRSIRTLGLKLRELGKREMPFGSSQLEALELHLNTAAVVRLIKANGTLIELFGFLQHSTPNYSAALITALNADIVANLIDKTIAEGRPIRTFHLALREMGKRVLPEGGSQLAAVEAHLSAAAILRLIRANGTIVQLFKFLQYNTPRLAGMLIAALDTQIVSDLVDKTILEGRSISTLSFALRELAKRNLRSRLEEKIGAEQLWRLIQGSGDLNDLAYLIESLTPGFVGMLVAADAAPRLLEWQALCRRGGFFELTRFTRDCADQLPPETFARFEEAARGSLVLIVEAASWQNLSAGLSVVGQIKNTRLRIMFEAAAFTRLDRQNIDQLAFADYMDSAAGLTCLWRREGFQPTLAARLWALLPAERYWPDDYTFFVGGKQLLEIGMSVHVSEADASRLLRSFSQLPEDKDVERCSPAALYQFIVSLFALWRMRRASIDDRFVDIQPNSFWIRVEKLIGVQAGRAGLNQGKLNVLALAGLLTLVLPGRTKRIAQALRGQIKGVSWLIEEAEHLTFVPAVLAVRGLSLLDPYQARFSPDRRGVLLSKAAEYEGQRAAVDFLCDWLRRDDKYHQPQRY